MIKENKLYVKLKITEKENFWQGKYKQNIYYVLFQMIFLLTSQHVKPLTRRGMKRLKHFPRDRPELWLL